jgi:hypothetical protein
MSSFGCGEGSHLGNECVWWVPLGCFSAHLLGGAGKHEGKLVCRYISAATCCSSELLLIALPHLRLPWLEVFSSVAA